MSTRQLIPMPVAPKFSALTRVSHPSLQRKCACGGKPGLTGECEDCRKKQLQRKAENLGQEARNGSLVPPIVHEVLRSPSQPLDAATRSFFEPRFGHDFSQVRVHADSRAAESAHAVNALAYTVGRDIVFGPGNHTPETLEGRSLMAHELIHVAQQVQGTSGNGADAELRIADENTRESEAITAERSMEKSNVGVSPIALQRKPEDAVKQCGGAWTCAASPCEQPDPGRAGNGGTPTEWNLKIMIDAEAPSAAEVTAVPLTIGHTYVEFTDSTGAASTYGFYPDKTDGTPDPLRKPEVRGCVVHPDTNHKGCVDYTETFKLSSQEYGEALKVAQLFCRTPPNYNIQTWNCTTFVKLIAEKASRSLPPIRGVVGSGMLSVTADNPYTLIEGLRKRDTGPTYGLTSDSEMRKAIADAGKADLSKIPVEEKIRVINRLVDGYFHDDDLQAIEKLCESVSSAAEMNAINKAVSGREKELNERQGKRFHDAISRKIMKITESHEMEYPAQRKREE